MKRISLESLGRAKKITAAAAVIGLVLYFSFLLFLNYRSQVRLQETTLDQLVQNLDKQATAISYFFSERRRDLNNLSQVRELNIFFENKALGMSMAYGLKASLAQIKKRFEAVLSQTTIAGTAVYDRIVFIDDTGVVTVDVQNGQGGHCLDLEWKALFLSSQESQTFIVPDHGSDLHLFSSISFFFKGDFAGKIVAWVNIPVFFKSLTKTNHGMYREEQLFIYFGDSAGKRFYPLPRPFPMDVITSAAPGQPVTFTMNEDGKGLKEYIGVRLPIEDTAFSLVAMVPVFDVLGHSKPGYLLLALGFLALFVLISTGLLVKMTAQELLLKTQLREESIRKEEIELKNIQLEQEIQVRISLEMNLKESEEKFRNISVSAQDAIIMLDHKGDITFWNPSAEKIFGFSEFEVMGKNFHTMMIPAGDRQNQCEIFSGFRLNGQGDAAGKTIELLAKRKNGTLFPVELSLSGIQLGVRWNVICIIRDISLRKLNEAELEKHRENLELLVRERTRELEETQKELLNKAMEAGRAQLSAMILHNIGNAVTPASVNAEKLKSTSLTTICSYLKSCYNELEEQKNDLTLYVTRHPRGIQVAKYMGTLINNLDNEKERIIELSRGVSTGLEYVAQILTLQSVYAPGRVGMKEVVDINKTVQDAFAIQEASMIKYNILVKEMLDEGIPGILIEKNKLMQVLVNLIKNSCDAINEGLENNAKQIEAATCRTDQGIRLTISDTGCGLEPEALDAVFKFGVSSKGSSGFGLYYCRSFIESNQGTLTLTSRGKGKGSTAVIDFYLMS